MPAKLLPVDMQYKRVSQLAPGLMPIRRLLPALALFLSSMSMTSTFLMSEAPRLGLGLAALGRPGYINLDRAELGEAEERKPEAMQARAWRVLDRAWDLGVRYFDCARSYGRSEEFLSNWLQHKQLRPEEIAVGSKWGYRYTADWRINTKGEPHEVKDHSLSHLDKQEQETKAFLGPHLRLYQIHSATLESGVLDNAEVLARLRSLREENGWRIGLSLSGVGQAATLKKALATEVFDAVQATWNLAEQSCGSALEEARRLGLEAQNRQNLTSLVCFGRFSFGLLFASVSTRQMGLSDFSEIRLKGVQKPR